MDLTEIGEEMVNWSYVTQCLVFVKAAMKFRRL